MNAPEDSTLVTGFPSYTARRMVLKLLAADPRERVFLLVRDRHGPQADELIAGLPPDQRKRLSVLIGDVSHMDLGLSGREYRTMVSELTNFHHMAAQLHLGERKELVEQVNVGGTRGALELALECRRLRRFNFWSTAYVSGDREGVVTEDELSAGQRFHNEYEHSKYLGETIVGSMSRRVPTTVFRPGIIVGDSRTGEIDRYDGPYHLLVLMVDAPLDLQLPWPGRGNGPLHLVPVDYVIHAAHALSRAESTAGRTFHLTDPCPLSARVIYQLVAERAHRKPRHGGLPVGLAKALLRLPGLSRLGGAPNDLLEGFTHTVFYNCSNTLEALRGTEIWCPRFQDYVDNLVRYVKDARAARRRHADEEISDPLD